ncbi:hypothetical protein [Cupriavidus oxalaticus]|uniref:hypothetical protein n=1 Tax=Cupriavidus oxalaticus TaxID=96344 RepID=UPI0040337C26
MVDDATVSPSKSNDEMNLSNTRVAVSELQTWLRRRGVKSGFFFSNAIDAPGYLDHNHPRYAPKLAAAVRAWEAVGTDPKYLDNGRTVKQNLESWLMAHAAEFDLVKDNREINANAIENQISKVANWEDKGGAPKTP